MIPRQEAVPFYELRIVAIGFLFGVGTTLMACWLVLTNRL